MWAQLLKTRVTPGREEEVEKIALAYQTRNNPAYLRHFTFENAEDAQEHYTLMFFTSEEEARREERDPEQHKLALQVQEYYSEPPVVVNLNPLHEHVKDDIDM